MQSLVPYVRYTWSLSLSAIGPDHLQLALYWGQAGFRPGLTLMHQPVLRTWLADTPSSIQSSIGLHGSVRLPFQPEAPFESSMHGDAEPGKED